MSISKQEFTNAGRSMLGRAQNGETLTISKIVVGSGSASQPSDLWPRTALITFEMNVVINAKNDDGAGQLLVEGVFRSDAAPHAFDLHEVGIMAHIGAEADRLYSVANSFTDPVDHIDPAAPTFYGYKIKLIVDRIPTASLVIQIGPTDAVMGENVGLGTVGPGVYKEAIANLLRFKRLEAGSGIALSEDAGSNKITIAAKQLTQNIDLYVPASYVNPPPGTLPEQFFATIQAAHDYLLSFHIPSDKFATIHVDGGHYTQAVQINFTHPDATQINVVGLDVVQKTVTGTITRAGTLPNLDITVPIPSGTAGIIVNDVVYLYDAPHAQLEGCGYVTQVLSTSIKIRMRIANVLPPSSIAALGTTKVLVFPTQFTTSMTSNAVFSFPNGCALMKNFALRSTTAQLAQAVTVNNDGALQNVLAVQFQYGFTIGGGDTKLTSIISANACGVGMQVGPNGAAQVQAPSTWSRITFSGNLNYGIWVAGGSYTTAGDGTFTWCCSNQTGIRSDTRGWVGVASATENGGYVIGFNDVGAAAVLLGIVQSAINVESAIQGNVTWDLLAANGGQVGLVYNATMSGAYSPALGVLSPSGGFIQINALNP